jgi:hypothetical protein
VEFKDQSVAQCLRIVARLVGKEVIRIGSLVIIGDGRASDRVTLVRRVRGYDASDISRVANAVLGGSTPVVFPDGLFILSASLEDIRRVSDVFDQIENVTRGVWLVQLHLISLNKQELHELGMDVAPALSLAAGLAATNQAVTPTYRGEVAFQSTMRMAQDKGRGRIAAQPLFYLVDGEEARFHRGQRLPVQSVSVQTTSGTTTTQNGVTYVSSGTEVTVKIREYGVSRVRLDATVDINDVTNLNSQGNPTTDNRSFKCPAILENGGTYLIGAIELGRRRQGRGTWLHWGQLWDESDDVLLVWAKCQRVDGAGVVPEAAALHLQLRDEVQSGSGVIRLPGSDSHGDVGG